MSSLFKTMATFAMKDAFVERNTLVTPDNHNDIWTCKYCGNAGYDKYAQGWHKQSCELRRAVAWVRKKGD